MVGPGAKAGGLNYVAQLGTWSPAGLPVRRQDPPPRVARAAELAPLAGGDDERAWLAAAAGSDAAAWAGELAVDRTGLAVERNVLRYRPVPRLARGRRDARPAEVLRLVLAAELTGTPLRLSLDPVLALPCGAPGRGRSTRSSRPSSSRPSPGRRRAGRVRLVERPRPRR